MDLDQGEDISCGDLKERLVALEKLLADPLSECYIERLLDVVIAAINDSRHIAKTKENEHMFSFFKRFASVAATLQSHRRQPQDFSLIASLGRGAFGRVQLVREMTTGRVCAMKVLKKSRMLTQHTDYWAEREIMARGESPWIVQLFYAFQDVTALYMVMEYVPGGTLVGWMEDVGVISEAACRFYAAETVLALSDLHAMGFIHRDLKPDNLLLDVGGHLKLADFGTAIRVDPETLLIHCDAAVGTPDYLSPEVLLSQGSGGGSYGFEVDWWALGVLVYEMLYGDTPFYSETLVNTYAKIMSHSMSLRFPETVNVSDSALDFMKQLLRNRECRLGSGPDGSVAVRSHAWFAADWADAVRELLGPLDGTDISLTDWTWSNIRACRAPFQPNLTSETDTSYFPLDPEDEAQQNRNSMDLTQPSDPLSDGLLDSVEKLDQSPEAETCSSKHPGSQLAFAGFSFSSSHPNNVALLNGLHLAPRSMALSDPVGTMDPGSTDVCEDPLSNHQLPAKTPSVSGASHQDGCPDQNEIPGSPPLVVDPSFQVQLSRVQSRLDEALALVKSHANAVAELTAQLNKAELENRALETKLAQRETAHRIAMEQAEQRLQVAQSEAAADLTRLKAEIAKWMSVAQSEQTARQSAEAAESIAVAAATARLAKQAAEVADRVAGTGSWNELSHVLPANDSAAQDGHVSNQSNDTLAGSNHVAESDQANGGSQASPTQLASKDNQTVATNSLLSFIEQMARRVYQAEATAREATDALEIQQRLTRLLTDERDEQADQLAEAYRKLEELRELQEQSEQAVQHAQERWQAARRALTEEQQRSARYRELAEVAKVNANAASDRTTEARREVEILRDQLEQRTQAYNKEKLNFTVTVNKLTEDERDVMSGENADALRLMLLPKQNDESLPGVLYPSSPSTGLSKFVRNRNPIQRNRTDKRLLDEIKRLNNELALARRSQGLAQMTEARLRAAETEIARLNEKLHVQPVHSRQSSDTALGSGARSGSVRTYYRSKPFVSQADDNGMTMQKVFSTPPAHMVSSISSTPEIPASHGSLVRHNSFGGKYVHAVQGPVSSDPDLIPSPMRVLADPTEFSMRGILELGVRQWGRKKLTWKPKVAQLTLTHLILAHCMPDNNLSGSTSAVSSALATPKQSRVQPVKTVFELPLTAVIHVRSINSCDLHHQPAEDVPRIFQLIYDRPNSGDTVLNGVTSNPGHSMTLPRRTSHGSASILATQSPYPSTHLHAVRMDSMSSTSSTSTRQSKITSPISMGQLDGLGSPHANIPGGQSSMNPIDQSFNQNPPSTPPVMLGSTGPSWPLPIQGHLFQRSSCRLSTSCDICRQPCHHLLSPPPVLQCTHCQFKLHASHVERQECTIPACDKSVIPYFFRCESESDKKQWIHRLLAAIQHAKGVLQNFALCSPSHDLPVSPGFRVSGATKTLPTPTGRTRTTTPSPDNETVCSHRSSRILDDSSEILTTDTMVPMDPRSGSIHTEKRLVSNGSANADTTRAVSPGSLASDSNSLVVVQAEQTPRLSPDTSTNKMLDQSNNK